MIHLYRKVAGVRDGGMNAVMYAAKQGHRNVVKFLHEQGADLNNRDDYGNNAMILTAVVGNGRYHSIRATFIVKF